MLCCVAHEKQLNSLYCKHRLFFQMLKGLSIIHDWWHRRNWTMPSKGSHGFVSFWGSCKNMCPYGPLFKVSNCQLCQVFLSEEVYLDWKNKDYYLFQLFETEIDVGHVLSYYYNWTSPQYCISEQLFRIANQKKIFTIYLLIFICLQVGFQNLG